MIGARDESEFHYNVIHQSIDCTITDLLVGLVWLGMMEHTKQEESQ